MTEAEAERTIADGISRKPSPSNEIAVAVAKAYSSRRTWTIFQPIRQPKRLVDVVFDGTKLKAIAEKVTPPCNWRHWLWERSFKRPEAMNAFSFLAHLYRPGETVLAFDEMESKTPIAKITISQPMDCRVPERLQTGGRGAGIWFLCNPVDGQWHIAGYDKDNQPDESCRNWQAITSWRYAVLESDQAQPDQWLAFLAQLPVRVSAIYTSGGRSIHCLIRLDAESKAAWDAAIMPLKRPLKVLGADAGALSGVRLTRLPGCARPEKNGFQRLLYLCPNPPICPLKDLPVLQSRAWTLARWRQNMTKEAFQ